MDTNTILFIAAIIGVFIFFLRELQTWFWKIDKRIEIQKEQTELLSKILYELKHFEFKIEDVDEKIDITHEHPEEKIEEPPKEKKKWKFFITDENKTQ